MKKIGFGAIGIFLLMQIFVQVLFKWGSVNEENWLTGFLVGNIISTASTWFMMLSYKHLNPNLAYGLAISSIFISSQVALSLIFRSIMTPAQWLILMIIAICMILFSMTGKKVTT